MKKKWKKAVSFVLASLIVLTACSQSSTDSETTVDTKQILFEKKDNTLHITMVDNKKWNPLLVTEESVDYAMKLVYEGLFALDENYDVENRLAQESYYGAQGKDMSIKIRQDARWHDGSQVSASDVKYTIDFLKSHPESPYYPMVLNIAGATVLGSKHIAIHLKQSNRLQEYQLLFPIIKSGSGSKSPFRWNGSGRYQFDKAKDVRSILLKEFSQYYGKKGKIKSIMIEMVKTEEIRSNLFLSTDSDIMNLSRDDISKYDYDIFEVNRFSNLQYEMILFNTKKEPFNSIKNRNALISGLDRDNLLKNGYRVEKSCNEVFIPKESILHIEDLQIPYDIKKSKQQFLSPKKREYELLVDSHQPIRFATANLIKQDLKKANIEVKVVGASMEELKKRLHSGNYDMAMIGYWTGFYPNIMKFAQSKNLTFYDMTALQQKKSTIDQGISSNSFLQSYKEFQKEFIAQAFYAGIGYLDSYVAVNRRLEGKLKSNSFDIYHGIEELSIVEKVYAKKENSETEEATGKNTNDLIEENKEEE